MRCYLLQAKLQSCIFLTLWQKLWQFCFVLGLNNHYMSWFYMLFHLRKPNQKSPRKILKQHWDFNTHALDGNTTWPYHIYPLTNYDPLIMQVSSSTGIWTHIPWLTIPLCHILPPTNYDLRKFSSITGIWTPYSLTENTTWPYPPIHNLWPQKLGFEHIP